MALVVVHNEFMYLNDEILAELRLDGVKIGRPIYLGQELETLFARLHARRGIEVWRRRTLPIGLTQRREVPRGLERVMSTRERTLLIDKASLLAIVKWTSRRFHEVEK